LVKVLVQEYHLLLIVSEELISPLNEVSSLAVEFCLSVLKLPPNFKHGASDLDAEALTSKRFLNAGARFLFCFEAALLDSLLQIEALVELGLNLIN